MGILTVYMCFKQSLADLTVNSVGSEPNDTFFLFDPTDFRAGSRIIDFLRHMAFRCGLSSTKTSLFSSLNRGLDKYAQKYIELVQKLNHKNNFEPIIVKPNAEKRDFQI